MGAAETSGLGGQRFGRYETLFRIAAGGMAEVYGARLVGEGGFEKMVALKRMLPTLAEDDRFVSMFLDEGKLAAQIESPHVVQTLDLGRSDDDSLYLVMELVVGVSLSVLLRQCAREGHHVPLPIAVEILAQAAQGLDDAHDAQTLNGEPMGLVHRDISPQNVMVDVGGRARITDFGVARAMERITHTQSGEVKGKLAYFSPEQAEAGQVDRRSDIFALGIVGWEMIAMRRLFAGDNPAQCLNKVLNMDIPRLDALNPAVPAGVADAVQKALHRDRDLRTTTAGEFARQLRAAMPAPPRSDVSRFVRAHGGETLSKIEAGIRSASRISAVPSNPASGSHSVGRRSSPGGSSSSPGFVPTPASGAADAGAGDDEPTTVTPATGEHLLDITTSARGRRDAAARAALPVPPPPPRPSAPVATTGPHAAATASASSLRPLLIGGAIALVGLLAAVFALARGGGSPSTGGAPTTAEAPMTVAAPAAETPPAAAPPVAAQPSDAPGPIAPAPGAPAAELAAPGVDPTAPSGAAGTTEQGATSPGRSTRRAGSHGSTPVATQAATPEPTPVVHEAAPEPRAPEPRVIEPRTTRPSGAPRPEALRGLDDFEREIGR